MIQRHEPLENIVLIDLLSAGGHNISIFKKKNTEPMTHNKAKHDKTRYTYIKRGINAIFDVYYINTWGHKELDMT